MSLVVSASDDREIKVWRFSENRAWEIITYRGHLNNISSVLFYANENIVISCSEDKSIRIWDLSRTRAPLKFQRDDCSRYWMLETHPYLNLLAASHDNGLTIFKLQSNNKVEINNNSNNNVDTVTVPINYEENRKIMNKYSLSETSRYNKMKKAHFVLWFLSLILCGLNFVAICYLNRFIFYILLSASLGQICIMKICHKWNTLPYIIQFMCFVKFSETLKYYKIFSIITDNEFIPNIIMDDYSKIFLHCIRIAKSQNRSDPSVIRSYWHCIIHNVDNNFNQCQHQDCYIHNDEKQHFLYINSFIFWSICLILWSVLDSYLLFQIDISLSLQIGLFLLLTIVIIVLLVLGRYSQYFKISNDNLHFQTHFGAWKTLTFETFNFVVFKHLIKSSLEINWINAILDNPFLSSQIIEFLPCSKLEFYSDFSSSIHSKWIKNWQKCVTDNNINDNYNEFEWVVDMEKQSLLSHNHEGEYSETVVRKRRT
eukprot:57230_1